MKRSGTICTMIILMLSGGAYASPGTTATQPAAQLPSLAKTFAKAAELSGKVVETMNAGGYTYVRIQKGGEKIWVAVPQAEVAVGQKVTVQSGQEMKGFTSKTLNRTFDSIIFSGGIITKTSRKKNNAAGAKHGKAAAAKQGGRVKVEKASGPGAYTVGDIFAKRTKLNKKTAVVKGRVVKVSSGIMNKNWIHLQDGSGNAGKGTNDLIVTMQDLPAVGEVITVRGTVHKDRDFGAGYNYTVIMEDARIQR